jgi:hypothetical protein
MLTSCVHGEAALALLMACKAAATVPFLALALGRQDVGIVTGNAAHSPVAGLETTALIHLLDVADGLAVAVAVGSGDKDRHDIIERQSRPIRPQ